MDQNLGPLAPEIMLAASAVAGLLTGSWLPRRRPWLIRAMAAAAGLAGLAAAGFAATQPPTADFGTATPRHRHQPRTHHRPRRTLLIICMSAGHVVSHPRETEAGPDKV